jgi:hypothetical protein
MSRQDVNLFIRYFLSTGLLRLSQKCHFLESYSHNYRMGDTLALFAKLTAPHEHDLSPH